MQLSAQKLSEAANQIDLQSMGIATAVASPLVRGNFGEALTREAAELHDRNRTRAGR